MSTYIAILVIIKNGRSNQAYRRYLTMKKNVISAALLFSLSAIGMNANADEIQFSGVITAASCQLVGGGNLVMQLPTFGTEAVQNVGQHNGVTSLNAQVVCPGTTDDGTVTMALMPNPNSFTGKVLNNTAAPAGAAEGVGIVVMGNDGQPLDFSEGSAANITAPMIAGNANIMISATYAKDGSGTAVSAGEVSAVLPFVMTYE
ncbi:fimbrial protein [Aeromonas popoffii]|uniref:fimbrial protein n=1 Tax=Aeromonas popoffii TaxID=70856 RepID=UPI0030CB178E